MYATKVTCKLLQPHDQGPLFSLLEEEKDPSMRVQKFGWLHLFIIMA